MQCFTCANIDSLLFDYSEGDLKAGDKHAFEEHLLKCERCRNEVEAYQDVISLAKLVKPSSFTKETGTLPSHVEERLKDTLEKELGISFRTRLLY
jgi:predicted anti-sigma-YlaC factor YlaD